jgi:hypothetical protein
LPAWQSNANNLYDSDNKMPKNPLYIDWAKSEARTIIVQDLKDGILSLDYQVTSVQKAWEYYSTLPQFCIVCYKQFREKLSAHRRALIKAGDRQRLEEAAVERDRRLSPVQKYNAKGVLRYDLSATKLLLREDVKNGWHILMTTAALKSSRPEYDEYSMRGFREHVTQEVKYQKFGNYLSDKREKDEQEKRAVMDKWKDEQTTIKAQQEQFTAEREADNNGKRLRTG